MENKNLKSFKDLEVWQKSKKLAVLIYKKTEKFPQSEFYGITNQMRRAVISISSNLAEGFKRFHLKEKIQFYNIAYGSAAELESQIEVSRELKFLSVEDYDELIFVLIEVSKMIGGLIKSLNPKSYILNSKSCGVAALPAIIVIAMVILLVGVGISSTGFIENLSSYGELENKKALAAAETGAADGFERLVRNRNCGGSCPNNYTIVVGDADADVVISDDTASTKKIVSTGRVGFKRVKIQVIVSFNANGKATQDLWQEITN